MVLGRFSPSFAIVLAAGTVLAACAGDRDEAIDGPSVSEDALRTGMSQSTYRADGPVANGHLARVDFRLLPSEHKPGRVTGIMRDDDGELLVDANFTIESRGRGKILRVRTPHSTFLDYGLEIRGSKLVLERDGVETTLVKERLAPEPVFEWGHELECKVDMEDRPSDYSVRQGGGTIYVEAGGARVSAHMLRTLASSGRFGDFWGKMPSGYFLLQRDGRYHRGLMTAIDPLVERPTEDMGTVPESTLEVGEADVEIRIDGTLSAGARVEVNWNYVEPSGRAHGERYDCRVK